ncbi:MAG: hypothetical protein NC124_02145 [Clostridium sp.]|nr:hypothetical protein [Clostridium sp.]
MLDEICDLLMINKSEILGSRRDKEVVHKKIVICHVFSALGYSTTQIGKMLHRDHTSVANLLRKPRPDEAQEIYRNMREKYTPVKYSSPKRYLLKRMASIYFDDKDVLKEFDNKEIDVEMLEEFMRKKLKSNNIILSQVCRVRKVPNYAKSRIEYAAKPIGKKYVKVFTDAELLEKEAFMATKQIEESKEVEKVVENVKNVLKHRSIFDTFYQRR